MASDSNGAFPQNQPYFQSNNEYPGYTSGLPNTGQGYAREQNWNFDTESLSTNAAQDQSPALYQGWHGSQQQFPSANNQFSAAHDATYGRNFSTPVSQYSNNSFVPSSFNRLARPDLVSFRETGLPGFSRSGEANTTYGYSAGQVGTVAPGVLQQQPASHSISPAGMQQNQALYGRDKASQSEAKPAPRGTIVGNFSIVSSDALSKVTGVKRLHNFVDIGEEPFEIFSTKTTIPSYVPRKSRNEIKQLLASDGGFTAKLAKKDSKRTSDGTLKITGGPHASQSATKREQLQTGDTASSPDVASSSEESETDESEEETMEPPLPPIRPTRAIEALKYDTVKSLWRVPYRSATDDDIRRGLAEFGDIVRTIRDRWKSDLQAVKDAEDAKKVNEVPLLIERVADQRDMLEAVLIAAVADGHKDIIEHLGENLQLILALSQFLRDRLASTDYSSSFSKAILTLLSKCKTLSATNLEKTNISKFLLRFAKRGDDDVKALSKRITDNANAAAKKRKEPVKLGAASAGPVKETPRTGASTAHSPVAGTKRSRPSNPNGEQPNKRAAAEPLGGAAASASGQQKSATAIKRLSTSSDTKLQAPTPATAPVKKATQVVAKPSSFFTNNFVGLQSAKKVNTAAGARPPVIVKPPPQVPKTTPAVPVTKPTPAVSRPTFAFADALASVSKPRVVETVHKREDTAPPETEDERMKRLRKEERRKLRVSFKPDSSLVQIREISPQLEDEVARNENEVRDAADVDSEGRMFKLKLQEDMMDLDDEDEAEMAPLDDLTKTFPAVKLIDFSTVPEDERQRMYIPFGGGVQKPECPEAEIQERREANTLIVVYARPFDVPPSPKEPSEQVEQAVELKPFGSPSELVVTRLKKLEEQRSLAQSAALPISQSALADILKGFNPQQQQQSFQPQSQPSAQSIAQQPVQNQNPASSLEAIFAQFATPAPNQTGQPLLFPPPPPQPQHLQQPQMPFNIPNLPPFNAPPVLQQVQQNQYLQPNAGVATNLSAILSALHQQSALSSSGQAQPVLGAMPDFSQYGQQSQQQHPAGGAYSYENPERRRMIESGGPAAMDDAYADGQDGGYGGNRRGNKEWNNKKREGGKPTPKYVVACKYWKEGKCRKGADCTFLHD